MDWPRINSLRACQDRMNTQREKSQRIKIKHPSIIIPFSDLCVCSKCLTCAFPWRNCQISNSKTELKAPSGDLSTCTVSNRPSRSGHLARPSPHPQATLSLISSYLSPGMQPLILKNTLSCNTLEKPCSTLQKKRNWHSTLWFTDLCVKTRQERSRFMTFWSDLNKYVLCWCYFFGVFSW